MSEQFQFGRRSPKNAPSLSFSLFASSLVIPEHPEQFNSIDALRHWDILGNDKYGDCVAVTWATVRRIVTSMDDGHDEYPGLDEVLAFYRTQNPNFDPSGSANTNGPGSNSDNGMDIQTALEYLVRNGGPDGVKALAFARLDHRNIEEVRAALAVFGFVWLGVNVTDVNESEFPDKPWSMQGNILGGHSVTGTGYDPSKFVMETWAHQSYLATDYVAQGTNTTAGVEEAWIVIWPEHAVRLGADERTAIDSAYFGLTGKHIAWPDAPVPPTPAPTPTPTPTPVPADPQAEFVAAAQVWLAHRHTTPLNKMMVAAVKKYLASLGV